MENLNFEHFLHTWKLPKSSVYLVFDRLNNSRLVFATSWRQIRLRSCHFHSAFCYVIIRWWRESGRVWPAEVVCSSRTLCKIVEIKIGGKTRFENLLKQLIHSPLLDMNTSYPTRAHGKIVIYSVIYQTINMTPRLLAIITFLRFLCLLITINDLIHRKENWIQKFGWEPCALAVIILISR